MTVIELHPEELLDREHRGQLAPVEQATLQAHLERCPECRLLRQARADFAAERASMDDELLRGLISPTLGELKQQAEAAPDVTVSGRSPWLRRAVVAAVVLLFTGTAAATTGWVRGWWSTAELREPMTSQPALGTTAPSSCSGQPPTPGPSSAAEAPAEVSSSEPTTTEQPDPDSVSVPAPAPEATALQPTTVAPPATPSHRVEARPAVEPSPAEPTAAALFAAAGQARHAGRYPAAIELYRLLQRRFPTSAEARSSRAILARLLLDEGQSEDALEGFDEYLEDQPGTLSEEAMVGRAVALQRLGRASEERADYGKGRYIN